MADSSTTGRNFIIAGVVLGLGAAAAGFYVSSSYDKQAINTAMRGEGKVAALAQKVKETYAEATRDTVVTDVAPEGAWIARAKAPEGKEPRYTPIFFAPNLWLVSEGIGKASMRDLLAMEDPEKPNPAGRVHREVPNEWFFRYGLDGIMGNADALELDSDDDGFTNGEEFAAGTDPSDATKHPAFVVGDAAKMVCVKRHTESHTIELSSMSDLSAPSIVINIYKGALKGTASLSTLPRIAQAKDKKVDDAFGLSDAAGNSALAKDRFKISAVTDDGIEVEDTRARTEEGRKFTLAKGAKNARAIRDVEVTLRVTAGADKGKEIDHAVQVGETFSIPGFPGTECTLISAGGKDDIRVKVGEKEVRIPSESAPSKGKK